MSLGGDVGSVAPPIKNRGNQVVIEDEEEIKTNCFETMET